MPGEMKLSLAKRMQAAVLQPPPARWVLALGSAAGSRPVKRKTVTDAFVVMDQVRIHPAYRQRIPQLVYRLLESLKRDLVSGLLCHR